MNKQKQKKEYVQIKAANPCRQLKVRKIQPLASEQFWLLQLESPNWEWTPGQFLMLRALSWKHDPLGARPFSIAHQDQQSLHIYIQALGKATQSLTRLCPGQEVLVWGPLGQGFELEPETPTLLLAGGMGLAPFVGLALRHPRPQQLELVFGHRQELKHYPFQLLAKHILAWNVQDKIEEDLLLLKRVLQIKIKGYAPDGHILACGPVPFLRMIQEIALEAGARTQLCLERYMACGVGACLACVVENNQGEYLQSCIHGPVFSADEIKI